MKIRKTVGETIFDVINHIFLAIICFTMLYPMLYVIFASLSNPIKLMAYRGPLLRPLDFSVEAYKLLLSYPMIWIGYRNTIVYVVVGTFINILLTTMGGYVLSRKNLRLKNPIMFFIAFTMYFSGGMIPTYLLVQSLGMVDTIWAMMIPGAISTTNLIIMRTGFHSVPDSLEESARIDGANWWQIFTKITVPLLKPVIYFATTMTIIGNMQLFDEPMIMIGLQNRAMELRGNMGMTLAVYMYAWAFNWSRFGMACATSYLIFLIIMVLTFINRLVFKED